MHFPLDIITWLKFIGAVATGVGSILLAFRVSQILKWVVYCLVAHEDSINKLAGITSNRTPMTIGVTKHLLDIESKLGLTLLIIGFSLLAIGMLCTAATYII